MKPRRKKPRTRHRALTQQERAAEFYRERDRLDRVLAEKIVAWAKIWEACPNAGCRRNARCLQQDDCRMHEDIDDNWPPEEERIRILEAIERLSVDDPEPKYDGDKVR
jgi:hypothetical protein